MTSKETKEPGESQGGRKPRGLGGVILILALLMALFFVVSSSAREGQSSIAAFYSHLLNGQLDKLTFSGDTASAEVRTPTGTRTIEVVVSNFLRTDQNEFDLYFSLSGQKLDTELYKGAGATTRFLADLNEKRIHVWRAFFVDEFEGRTPPLTARMPANELRREGTYLTAMLQKDSKSYYVRIDAPSPASGDPSLQQVTSALQTAAVPLRHFPLSLSPQDFRVSEPNTALIYILGTVGPWLLVLIIVWFFILRQMRSPGGSGGVLSFGRSRASLYTKENRTNITFEDVAGMEEAKAEVREIIEFLKNPAKFARLGGSIPRGVLLVGSPGTGKTLLAKAIAGEAEVPFFSISGSDFVEMFVGVGASRVRDLFKQAREASPCIVFLDEIDAVGRKRGTGMGGGHDEREQTLNAILVEMDGFDSDKGIILIGATNRPDVLDPALLRPGRFDRQVTIDRPDVKGREAILKVHARKVKLAGYVDLVVIAKATAGFSGAELAAVINEAAILAAMKNKDAIDMSDLEEGRDRVRWGREKRSRAIEEEDKKVTAYHEAGHALVSILTPDQDPVHKVTIVSRGRALGATMSLPEKDDYNHWRKKLLGRIAVCFGGRIAEDLVFGDVSAGAQNDIEQATNLARVMVCELGMSPKVGPIKYTADDENPFLGREFRLGGNFSERTLELIDEEVKRLVDDQYRAATQLLQDNRQKLDAVAAALLKHETLSGDEIGAVMRGDDLEEYRQAQLRLQQAGAQKRAESGARAAVEPPPLPADKKPDIGLSGA
ncbi:MAG: ATP-dependent zinc metalloprotease FtsH [Planctomycetes bacterium]|jgi:cell division protease FtsH|nr:ATP-dependent zinc metalloprotease FtsH [Planctomycetota bacterium]